MKTLTTDEHLNAIVSKCKANLALAEKRIDGNWIVDNRNGSTATQCGILADSDHVILPLGSYLDAEDAAFIVACAGSAEAGWRSTIAAIEGLQQAIKIAKLDAAPTSDLKDLLSDILSAWPDSLLQ